MTEMVPRAELDAAFVEFAASGDRALRERLVEAHTGLAITLADRYASRAGRRDDLRQVAMLGLVLAVDRFDPGRGVSFSTFAWSTISGELKRYLRDHAWGMRLPRSLQDRSLSVGPVLEELQHRLGRSPTYQELGEELGCSAEEVAEAVEAATAHQPRSLNATTGDDERDLDPGRVETGYDRVDLSESMQAAMACLSTREARIVSLRFELGLSQAAIGEVVGLSQMHVSRLLRRSLDRLRAELERPEDTKRGRHRTPCRRDGSVRAS